MFLQLTVQLAVLEVVGAHFLVEVQHHHLVKVMVVGMADLGLMVEAEAVGQVQQVLLFLLLGLLVGMLVLVQYLQ
jgi:hypothetical protein